jgi:AsmA protein
MKWFKRLGLLFVAIVLVAILGAVAFVATFDPNDYKDQIAAQVEKQTGRSIQFNGDLSVTIFPWLGAATEDVALGNAEGFEPPSMLKVQRLEAQAALLPLLRGEFEIGTLLLEGAEIHLARNAEGRTNWDDLVERQGAAPDDAGAGGQPAGSASGGQMLTIGGVDIRDATLHWRDAQTGQDITVDGLDLRTGALASGEATTVELASGFRLELPDMPPMTGQVDLSAEVQAWFDRQDVKINDLQLDVSASREGDTADAGGLPRQIDAALRVAKADVRGESAQARLEGVTLEVEGSEVGPTSFLESRLETVVEADWERGRYQVPSLSFSVDAKGVPGVAEPLSVSGSATASADMQAGTATLADLVVDSDPVTLRSDLSLAGLNDGNLTATGPVTIDPFDPRMLAERLGITLPETRGEQALSRASLSGQIDVTPSRAMLDELTLALDGKELAGRAGIDNLESGRLFARLQGGEFDLNPYLAPRPAGEEASGSGGGSGGGSGIGGGAGQNAEIELPMEALRGLNLDARLQLSRLIYEKYRIDNPVVHVTAAGGQIRVTELVAQAFEGSVNGSGALDVRSDVPAYSARADIANVALQPMLMAVMDEDRLLGKGNLSFDVATQGKRVDQLKSALEGNADVALSDGKIKGFDIGYLLRRAQARLEGRTEPEPAEKSTDFTSITGTATIRNGVVRNDDLAGASPMLRVAGKGQVDLPRETIDYGVTATVVNTATGQGGKELERLKQVPVPIRIKGPFSDPSITLDMQALAREAVKGEVKQRLEEELDKRLGGDDVEDGESGSPVRELLKGFGL